MRVEAQEVCERVWRGRSDLRDLCGSLPDSQVRIVVSPNIWELLMEEARGSVFDPSPINLLPDGLILFGMPIKMDGGLEEGEVRFRSEVVL